MSAGTIEDIYPLTPMQQGMLFHSLYAPESGVYVEQMDCPLHGRVDVLAFERAWGHVIERHPILRTAFLWEELDEPLQVVQQQVDLPFEQRDWRGVPLVEQAARLEQLRHQDQRRGFDLSEAPLMRLTLLQTADDAYHFVWTHHHLLIDGWSLPLLLQEVFACYEAFRQGRRPALPHLRPYRDYIAWLQDQNLERTEAFWRQSLAGISAPTPLAFGSAGPAAPDTQADQESGQIQVPAEATATLTALARQHQITLSTIVQGAWALLLSRYSGEVDVVYGVTVSGRPVDLDGAERMIGLFINTLPVRVAVRPEATLLAWLKGLQAQQVELRQYEYSPLIQIQEWSAVPRSLPLFESILVFENYPVDDALREQQGSLELGKVQSFARTNYPLTVVATPGRALTLDMIYDRRRFDAATIERMLGQLRTLLEGMTVAPDCRVSALPLLSEAERRQLLIDWNATAAPFPQDQPVHRLFEAQAARSPNAVALMFDHRTPTTDHREPEQRTKNKEQSSTTEPRTKNQEPGDPTQGSQFSILNSQFSYVTYGELNRRANQLAHHLRRLGVGPEVLVGICAERSPELIVGLLGVLKAGGAYVPLDPAYPAERLQYMLDDAQVAVLLTTQEQRTKNKEQSVTDRKGVLHTPPADDERAYRTTPPANDEGAYRTTPPADDERAYRTTPPADDEGAYRTTPPANDGQRTVIDLVADWETIARLPETNLDGGATGENLAYVIYTSGSTGKPKGVLLQHHGLVNLALEQIGAFALEPGSRILQFASFSFDAAVSEIFTTLLAGAALVLADRETLLSVPDLLALLREQEITVVTLPPSLLALLPAEELPALRTVVSAGERCTAEIAARWMAGRRFLNAYGPTEATIGPCWYHVTEVGGAQATVPIGRPIANIQLYVLDQRMEPLPIGAPGELYLGGVGLARGYLGRPELTAERFVPNPFLRMEDRGWRMEDRHPPSSILHPLSSRLYRTGDLVRYLPDGNVEFLGRIDQQVKIRGFRVELEEIEAALRQHAAVEDAIVLVRNPDAGRGEDTPGEQRLVAYVVPDQEQRTKNKEQNGETPDSQFSILNSQFSAELRAFLKDRLPEYMLPSAFVLLAAWPMTPNGKVDRKALPAPDGARLAGGDAYAAPRTPTEEILAGVWSQLLGVALVGIHDDFFALGGHSLLATRLISRVREVFAVELPVRSLFETPTVAGLAGLIEASARTRAGLAAPPVTPVPREGPLPLSFAQQRLWFLDQLEPDSPFYNNPVAMRVNGQLDVAVLERSLNEVVRRHEALRTTFATVDGQPIQVIATESTVPVAVVDLREGPPAERKDDAQRLLQAEARRPFDLARGPVLRAALFQIADDEQIILLTLHHIVSDGWSMGVLIREIALLYDAFSQGQPSPLAALPVQYADFAAWQRTWLQGQGDDEASPIQSQLAYWKEQLRGVPDMLDLPTDRPRPAVQTSSGATKWVRLPKELLGDLIGLSRQEGATLFMTLLAAFQTLLYRYSGQEDINVGTPIANRTRGEIEPLIGFFVNTLVLRADLSGDPTFRELLTRVREAALGAYAHQDVPFEMVVEALQPARTLSHTPLFQVMLVLDNAPMEAQELTGLTLNGLDAESGTARFDLTLELMERPDGLYGALEYNTDLFDAATIERMLGHFQILLEGIVADPDCQVSALPLLSEAERRQVLVEWNATTRDYPDQHCFHHLFERQVELQPDALALLYEGQRLTYHELNQQANRLAHYLQARGVGPEALVGICVERSPAMIVAVLAVLKAGGAYLPLDPNYPTERLQYMLEDAQVAVLLTTQEQRTKNQEQSTTDRKGVLHTPPANDEGAYRTTPPANHERAYSTTPHPTVIELEGDWDQIALMPATNPSSGASADSLAYVIYTSGSTGRPKGTLLRHRGLCNLLTVQRQVFAITPESRVLQFAPFSFDASVWETVMALGNGAALVLAPQARLVGGAELLNLLREAGVTTVTLPPSVLSVLDPDALPALQTVIAAGEACSHALVERWGVGRRFVNAYGPTETTVCASLIICDPLDPRAPSIGRPLPNVQLYVLDRHLQPLPIGVPGELYIGGLSLARGYLHRPELTAERFVPCPWSVVSGQLQLTTDNGQRTTDNRLYKSGDLVRYRADGELEFLGRVDQQVKLRGFRIELGEVAAVLRQHAGVQDALVLARNPDAGRGDDVAGEKRLVAYVVPAQEQRTKPVLSEVEGNKEQSNETPASQFSILNSQFLGELRAYLRERLPEYMVPWGYVMVEEWPLTPSGKVDRGALPLPDGRRSEVERAYVAPRNETEATLAGLCGELLGLAQVGVEDNFFELGGHSLLATKLISRIRERFQVEIPLRSLFEHPTVSGLAEAVEQARLVADRPQAPAIVPLSRDARRAKRSSLAGGNGSGSGEKESVEEPRTTR